MATNFLSIESSSPLGLMYLPLCLRRGTPKKAKLVCPYFTLQMMENILYMLGLIVYLIWIQMLRMDTNVMNLIYVGFDCLSHLDTKVKEDTNVMNLI